METQVMEKVVTVPEIKVVERVVSSPQVQNREIVRDAPKAGYGEQARQVLRNGTQAVGMVDTAMELVVEGMVVEVTQVQFQGCAARAHDAEGADGREDRGGSKGVDPCGCTARAEG